MDGEESHRRPVVNVPDWWEAALLALASWRVFQLVAFDNVLDQARRYVTRAGSEWQPEMSDVDAARVVPANYRGNLAVFLTCPYCAGFWIVVLWWLAWLAWPDGTLFFAAPWALSAGVIAGHKLMGSE